MPAVRVPTHALRDRAPTARATIPAFPIRSVQNRAAPDLVPTVADLTSAAAAPAPTVAGLTLVALDLVPTVVDLTSAAPAPVSTAVDLTLVAPAPVLTVPDLIRAEPDLAPTVADLSLAAPALVPTVPDLIHAALDLAPTVADLTRAALDPVPTVADPMHAVQGLALTVADLTHALRDRTEGRVATTLVVVVPRLVLTTARLTFIVRVRPPRVGSPTFIARTSTTDLKSLLPISRSPTLLATKPAPTSKVSKLRARSLMFTSRVPTLGRHPPLGAAAPAAPMPKASACRRCCLAPGLHRVARPRIGFAPGALPSTANPPCSALGCRIRTNFASMAA